MLRQIKSYVLRAGRISNRQQQGLDLWLKEYELPYNQTNWSLDAIFERKADTIIEIGFGMGNSLLTMAKDNPQINYIGIEVHRAGVGALAADIHEHQLTNLKIVMHDAVEVLNHQIPDSSLAGIQIFFPDPWHKKRHHKRRLIQTPFVQLLVQKLQPGGYIHCATDWQEYAEHMLELLSANTHLKNQQVTGGFSPRPSHRPLTKFETRGERLGHGVWDLVYTKV